MILQARFRERFQFSLRALFVLTAVVAIYFSMSRTFGYIEASGTFLAIVILLVAWRWRTRSAWLLARVFAGIVAATLLWMVAVDWSWFVEGCDDCWMDRDVIQIRVYRMPVYETTREYGILHHVAADLGVPCSHEHATRWHKYRFWGLIYPASPCIEGTLRLSGDDWYDEAAAEIVRAKVKSSPRLAEEFRQRVLVLHDSQYIGSLLAELKQARANKNDALPSPPKGNQDAD